MNIEHNFQYKVGRQDLLDLFQNTKKISQFKRKLEQLAERDPNNYDRDKCVGDGFEFFVELMLKALPHNLGLGGIYNYSPVQEDDNGVDGVAWNFDGDECVIQVKFRSDTNTLLTANKDHLSNMVTEATLKYGITPDGDRSKRYFIITTAKGLHYYTNDDFFKNKVTCIGYNDLRKLVDGNVGFWEKCLEVCLGL